LSRRAGRSWAVSAEGERSLIATAAATVCLNQRPSVFANGFLFNTPADEATVDSSAFIVS
jgi:hypothetical protein